MGNLHGCIIMHDEICTALLYGKRAGAMYDIDSRCVNMLYQ